MATVEDRLKEHARELGFELAGIAPACTADGFDSLREWLDRGYSGEMTYMKRHIEARRHPSSILPDVRSVVMVAMSYKPDTHTSTSRQLARISSYAQGADYHGVLRQRLKSLLSWLQEKSPGCRGRAVIDTAPLLERDFARRAGLGWIGKNTMLIHKRLGSFLFLGALLIDVKLAPDAAHEAAHCGTCTACLDACPTEAFVAPGVLDARRCISYLTIELRGSIPESLREPMGDWLFGCDICQDVCPWNRKAPPGRESLFQSRHDLAALDLNELLGLSEEEFCRRFRGTAMMRPGRMGLLRNAAIVLGNIGGPAALPALEKAAVVDNPVLQEAAAWAIMRIRERSTAASGNSPTESSWAMTK